MAYPVYYVLKDDTLPHLFDTFDGGDGSSITLTGLAVTDIEIYKDGGTTQRSSDNGYTLLDTDGIDFDGTTGIHGFSIDLSDNSDAGFYEVGPWYHVVIASVTIDSQTVNFVACAFRILDTTRGMAGTALPDAAADAAGGLPISDAGGLDLDAMNTNINDIETDTNALNDTKIPDTISLANINAEVDTALTDIGLDHLVSAAVVGADVTDNSIVAYLVSASATADWDDFVNTTDSLQAIRDHVGDGSNLSEAGGTGDHLTAIPWNAAWDAEVESEVTDALEADGLDHLVSAAVTGADVADNSIIAQLVDDATTADWDNYDNTTASLEALNVDTDAIVADTGTDGVVVASINTDAVDAASIATDAGDEIADQVWDEARSGHTTAGTYGEAMSAIVSGSAATGTLSTTQMTSDLSEATDDHYIGRTVVWITGALTGQASDITDYSGTNGLLTFSAVTEAPSDGDQFILV